MIMARAEGSSGVRNGSSVVRRMSTVPSGGPTVPRRLLGAQLRRLREERGITLEDAGEVIRASGSKMSRLETGRVGFKDRDIADLLTFYEVTDDQQRGALLELARNASAHGWWHDYSDVLPAWFEAYVGLEEAATSIRAYEIQFVPGLLQTEDYARAVTLLGPPRSSSGSGCGWPARPCWPSPGRCTYGPCSTRRCCAAPRGVPA
jgi:transcriptional regulator with XRE-family HTH domain